MCKKSSCKEKCVCSTSVKYTGPSIECIGIEQNVTSQDEAVQILGEYLCNLDLDIQSIDHISFIQSTGAPSTTPNQAGEVDTYQVWGDTFNTINLGQFTVYNGTNGTNGIDGFIIVPILYSELLTLYNNQELVPGVMYHITDRDYFMQALDTSTLFTTGFRKQTILIPAAYIIGGGNLGVWRSTLTPTIGDYVTWGGKCWTNTSGIVGSATDESALSADWAVNSVFNFEKLFEIKYDFINDWVSKQEDDRGNSFGFSFVNLSTINPTDISDWGNPLITNNKVNGVYNNKENIIIKNNTCAGSIFSNKTPIISIELNSNKGNIESNANTGSITSNANLGKIDNNINVGVIGININKGDITGNSNNGVLSANSGGPIVSNSNAGAIILNNNPFGIYSNSNNGTISYNSNDGVVSNNTNIGYITGNRNSINIVSNSNTGNIVNNANTGTISLNTNIGDISNNSNEGEITGNSNLAEISFNNNRGIINGNSNTNFIKNNNNIGRIANNSNNGIINNNKNIGGINNNTSAVATTFDISTNSNSGIIAYNNSIANIIINNNINNGIIGDVVIPVNRNVSITDTIVNK